MTNELKMAKREAKELGINTTFEIRKDSTGCYDVTQYGKDLANGYNITECRVFAINELISEHCARLDRQEEARLERAERED